MNTPEKYKAWGILLNRWKLQGRQPYGYEWHTKLTPFLKSIKLPGFQAWLFYQAVFYSSFNPNKIPTKREISVSPSIQPE